MHTVIILAALVVLPSPEEATTSAVIDIQTVEQTKRQYVRYLASYPLDQERQTDLNSGVPFWVASLSNRRAWKPPRYIPEDQIYRINDYRDYDWSYDSWEKLGEADPYFQAGKYGRPWIDPKALTALQTSTGSKYPILRADYFIAKTSLDRKGVGILKGYYSDFKNFPATEQELYELLLIDPKKLGDNLLLRGGGTLQSPVALHNRQLESIPTPIGKDQRFLWRSLDTASDLDNKSILRKLAGTVEADGKEFIGSGRNGLHYYWIGNGKGEQVAEVPINIARDKTNEHYPGVLNPYSCVRCHGPNSGIQSFADVITKIILDPNTAINVYGDDAKLKYALEEYHQSELGQEVIAHQASYAKAIFDITGLTPEENTKAYIRIVEGYLFGRIDLKTAAAECGVTEDQIKILLKASGNPDALALVAGSSLSREAWEKAFPQVMGGQVYKWEHIEAPKELQPEPKPEAPKVEERPKEQPKPKSPKPSMRKRPRFYSDPGTSIPNRITPR